MTKGSHTLLDLDNCQQNLFYAATDVKKIELKIKELGLEIMSHDTKVFKGNGYTSYFLLAESHVSIHTWPEINRVYADIFLCNYSRDNSPLSTVLEEFLIEHFQANSKKIKKIQR